MLVLVLAERLTRILSAFQPIMERYGLQHVRGCEVIELRDGEGKLLNDFSGRNKREAWAPARGTERTLVVALDTAQYQARGMGGLWTRNVRTRRT
jgi:hypothetical protein